MPAGFSLGARDEPDSGLLGRLRARRYARRSELAATRAVLNPTGEATDIPPRIAGRSSLVANCRVGDGETDLDIHIASNRWWLVTSRVLSTRSR